jgi:hypothetical protein
MFSVVVPVTLAVVDTVLGGPKNEVMDPLDLGFFASERPDSVALRLRDIIVKGRRKRSRRDSLDDCGFSLWESMDECGGWCRSSGGDAC